MAASRQVVWVGLGVCVVGLTMANAVLVPRSLQPVPSEAPRDARSGAVDSQTLNPLESVGEEPAPTTLTLLSTWVAEDPTQSLALLFDVQRNKRAFVRLGNRIGSWTLSAIEQGWVLFTSPQGGEVRLELEEDALRSVSTAQLPAEVSDALAALPTYFESPTAETVALASEAVTVVSEQERVIDRTRLFTATEGNPLRLLSQGRVVPHLEGAQSGLQVTWLADSPWAEKVGVQMGDVVTAVNGKPVFDPLTLGEIATDLFSAPMVDLAIQRDGRDVTLHYQMVDP